MWNSVFHPWSSEHRTSSGFRKMGCTLFGVCHLIFGNVQRRRYALWGDRSRNSGSKIFPTNNFQLFQTGHVFKAEFRGHCHLDNILSHLAAMDRWWFGGIHRVQKSLHVPTVKLWQNNVLNYVLVFKTSGLKGLCPKALLECAARVPQHRWNQ